MKKPKMAKASNQESHKLPFDNSPYIIPLYKPKGISSFDCIRLLKKDIFTLLGKGKGRRKLKIGHFGTLDPFAEGLLLVGTGKALKLMQLFQLEMTKTYKALGSLKFSTDTGDCDGKILKNSVDKFPSSSEIENNMVGFRGDYLQSPPYFSAVKHEGRPLYEWAREGVFIDKDPVKRHIYSISFEGLVNDQVSFSAEVSSGTYIRGLWVDIAKSLGLEGHLVELKRSKWGSVTLEYAYRHELGDLQGLKDALKRPHELFALPHLSLGKDLAKCFVQGQFIRLMGSNSQLPNELKNLDKDWAVSGNKGWVFDASNELLGLGEIKKYGIKGESGPILKVSISLN